MASLAAQWPHASMRTAEGITLHYVDGGLKTRCLWCWCTAGPISGLGGGSPGFGQSSTPQNVEAYGAKNVTNDLAALLDGLNIEKAVFLGHDWGGGMVWRMCLYHPERVIAVGAVPYFSTKNFWRMLKNTGKMLDTAPRRFLTAVFRKHSEMSPTLEDGKMPIIGTLQGVTNSTDPIFTQRSAMLSEEELQYYVDQYTLQVPEHVPILRDSRDRFQGRARHVFYHQPPSAVHQAANDHVLKPELARKMHRFLPNLETHVVDDAGHWVLWEQKERVNAILKSWLDKIPAPVANRSKL
ncbi:Alpha/Beta hydrolase fold [Phytophthora cactorum]|nr:Alpha/Beta hydrolase fold [Phytophthora cactorum]